MDCETGLPVPLPHAVLSNRQTQSLKKSTAHGRGFVYQKQMIQDTDMELY